MVTFDKCEGLPCGGDSLRVKWVVPLGGAGENPFKLLGSGFFYIVPLVGANRISYGIKQYIRAEAEFRLTPIRKVKLILNLYMGMLVSCYIIYCPTM